MKLAHARIIAYAHACLDELKMHRDSLVECHSLIGADLQPVPDTLDTGMIETVTQLDSLIEAIEADR